MRQSQQPAQRCLMLILLSISSVSCLPAPPPIVPAPPSWGLVNNGSQGNGSQGNSSTPGDYDAIKRDVQAIVLSNKLANGPILIRLGWHTSGTYDGNATIKGGSNGATMRFLPERNYTRNIGLTIAHDLLEPVKLAHPWVTYADLWTYSACVAVETMGGPHIPWRPGRYDALNGSSCPPEDRLPDETQGAGHIRMIFGRMGFTEQEAVALLGAHAVGRAHLDRSGYEGPWTTKPDEFTISFYANLMIRNWVPRNWTGPLQFKPKGNQTLMMLPTDMALKTDPVLANYTVTYQNNKTMFFEDFANAFKKLVELGVEFEPGTPEY